MAGARGRTAVRTAEAMLRLALAISRAVRAEGKGVYPLRALERYGGPPPHVTGRILRRKGRTVARLVGFEHPGIRLAYTWDRRERVGRLTIS